MNRVRFFLLMATVSLVGLVAFGLGSLPQVEDIDSQSFSAERIIEDIKVISRDYHSVAQPKERAEVREYLLSRLEQLGADTVMLFEYKGLTGPENKHVKYTFDATNIFATFAPEQAPDCNTSLLLVAHYDSRFSQPFAKGDTVWSYGAADDGYGVGVILETVNQALKYRNEWKQGIKVLFTDAEEAAMMGMKEMWKHNREQFDDVGLMINLEARGPYGPVLLFETSPGNEKVMQLYESVAEYPFTYSLTTVVYKFMPNYTDFTIVKDDIPGLNFSTIADINHYHSHLDNISNVNARSIQHYGSQIIPIVREYLTKDKYSDLSCLKSDVDTISFTFPLLGLFNFSKAGYLLLNIVIFILFFALVVVDVLRNRVRIGRIVLEASSALLLALGAVVAGEVIVYLCCLVADAEFKLFGVVQGVMFDNAAMLITVMVVFAAAVALYIRRRSKVVNLANISFRDNACMSAIMTNAANKLYGVSMLMMLSSLLLLIFINENLMFFIPLFASVLAMVLYRLTGWKLWLLLAVALISLHAFSFLYALSMALTIGAYGAVLMLALLDMMAVIPLADIYITDSCIKKQ